MLLLVQTFSTSYLLFCTALLIFQGIQNVSADEDYLEKCCGLGSSWAAQKLRCERFTGPVVGVPREEQSGCLEAVQICCKKSFQDQRCNQGKIEAKAGVACVNLDTGSKRLPIGLGDFQRDCCEACKLGILHGSSGNGCVLQKFSLGIPWDPAFMECCTEALLTTIRDASSTSNTTRIDRPISNITTLEDNGIDDQSNKNDITDTNYSTFNLDDLCKLMKGLLCSEICIPTPGSYYCKCHEGSTLQEDGRTCKSNGTETLSSKLNASFHNIFQPINGSISPVTILKTLPRTTRSLSAEDNDLQCPSGYRFNTSIRTCDDIDECAEGSHTCGSEKCYNLPGSFQCAKAPLPVTKRKPSTTPKATVRSTPSNSCNVGSRFDNTRGGCIDINECEELEEACSYNEKCINTPGSFRCECRTGFRREELTRACVDINECQLENDCQSTQRCDNTIGSYTCVRFLSCGTGYTLNAATEICEDDNECLLGTHDCQPGFYCRNTLGSFRCDRPRGNATTVRPTTRRTIKPTFSSTIAAYTTARSATTSMNNPITTATPRSTTTLKPTTRMTSSERPSTRTPKITTSSTARSPTTTKKATTTTEQVPTVGALTTTTTTQRAKTTIVFRPRYNCPRGFESGPLGECVDIDECQRNLKICGAQRCVNLLGSFKCIPQVICGIGFAYDPLSSTCKDIDECAQGTHKCGADQTCENKQGGYICYCPPGYEIDAEHNCVDIDECTRVQPGQICGINNKCINTPGSYRCLCGPGFENDATGICRDIDECKRKSGLCQQQCYNTWGGHRCGCQSGYRLKSDNRTCEDVDECNEFRENNLCVGICDNTPGSYICRCPDGYKLSGDGRTCLDIDECAIGNVCKAESELCQNVGGGFRCNKINCPSGYIRDLQRKNRCMRESQLCPLHDEACFQRPAHYTYNYIGIVSMYPIPTTTGQVELFTMRGAYIHPGSTVRFTMSFIQARAPPHVQPATESCFALRKPYPHQAVLVLTKSLQGPQDIELEFSMEIYGSSGEFAGSAVAKIFIVVTQYEF